MLATRLRVSPCSDRLVRSSSGRLTTIWPPGWSNLTSISGRYLKLSFPLGPSTWIVESAIATFTVGGTGTGLRPIRDMGLSSSAMMNRVVNLRGGPPRHGPARRFYPVQ